MQKELAMKVNTLGKMMVIAVAMGLLTGFGLGDLNKALTPGSGDCSKAKDPKKCKKEQELKTGAKVLAVGVAAKLIHDMIIDYRSSQTKPEDQVVQEYKKTHPSLPKEPEVVAYTSSIKPGEVVKAGKEVLVNSSLVVVPGVNSKAIDIQEQIDIHDNEKNEKVLKTLTKSVNEKTKKSGAFNNEFKFTLPVGMPQGVYPIKTQVLVNGKAAKPTNNKMQLVLNVDRNSNYTIVAIAP